MVDERPPQLAVVGPDLAKDRIDLRLGEAFAGWKGLDHLGPEELPPALAGGPAQDASIVPEGTQLSDFLRGDVSLHGHVTIIVKTKIRATARVD